MRATGKGRGLAARPFILLTATLLLFGSFLAVPALAADDSNSGPLTPAPTISSQQLNSALGSLAQGSNDTQLQQLLTQLQSQLNSGDLNGAASTLLQLQNYSSDPQNNVSESLNALLQSMSVGGNGASIDANALASLLNASQTSQAANTSSQTQQKLSVDMQTLANLLQYANPAIASQLLQNSALLSQNAFAGSSGQAGGSPIKLPGVSGFPGLSLPSVGGPSVSVGGVAGGLPAITPTVVAIPVIILAAVAALFLSRNRVMRLVGSQRLPRLPASFGGVRDDGVDSDFIPSDPRRRIEFYFGKAVSLMARRGVPKLESETAREFSSKCESRQEEPHVKTISSLYEKAKFSGQSVGQPDADSAETAFFTMGKDEA
ncbi:MAG: DUF4129 domain-containing protein [Thaumarchaeota archaeon]|nr:DUF4129 domain-containing protein [Nitrososphaerota archaeon]